jgi:hypothetical protein
MPANKDIYPPTKMPLEDCNSEWILREKDMNEPVTWIDTTDRYYLDIRRKDVREAIINLAVMRAKSNGLDAVCYDNCYWGLAHTKASISAEEWTGAFMKFYKEAGEAAHAAGLKCLVNVATHPSQIIPAFLSIAPYVDGLMTEQAFHRSMRTPEFLVRELKGYEEILKQGKIVLLSLAEREDEQFGLLAVWPLASRYSRIYVSVRGPANDEPLYWLTDYKFDIGVDCEDKAGR